MHEYGVVMDDKAETIAYYQMLGKCSLMLRRTVSCARHLQHKGAARIANHMARICKAGCRVALYLRYEVAGERAQW